MNIAVGAFEAKVRFSELLRGVKAGKRYTITKRGAVVADLVPSENSRRQTDTAAIADMKAFMLKNPVKKANIRALIDEGRS